LLFSSLSLSRSFSLLRSPMYCWWMWLCDRAKKSVKQKTWMNKTCWLSHELDVKQAHRTQSSSVCLFDWFVSIVTTVCIFFSWHCSCSHQSFVPFVSSHPLSHTISQFSSVGFALQGSCCSHAKSQSVCWRLCLTSIVLQMTVWAQLSAMLLCAGAESEQGACKYKMFQTYGTRGVIVILGVFLLNQCLRSNKTKMRNWNNIVLV